MLEKFSFGVGDRFGRQGRAQLRAFIQARDLGLDIVPVWNKSHREHSIIHTSPMDVRRKADEAVAAQDWPNSYYVDADHIGMSNVDLFLDSSDFFTLDVADFIGIPADDDDVQGFVQKHEKYVGALKVPSKDEPLEITQHQLEGAATKFLPAIREAGKIYRRIKTSKGDAAFVTEVSMDETDQPQTPLELFVILAALADEGIPVQTIAPKFTGRFNKGVDYVGDVEQFSREFDEDLCIISYAVQEFGLPSNLKLSVHSGSDKFSIYGPIREALNKHDVGLHVKTAGTTWLEELAGLALAGGGGLELAKEIYADALGRFDELCGPYSTVIDIDKDRLPAADDVDKWTSEQFAAALQHDQSCDGYNQHMRQLIHVAYKVAVEKGDRFMNALDTFEERIAPLVTENLFQRHIKPIFV